MTKLILAVLIGCAALCGQTATVYDASLPFNGTSKQNLRKAVQDDGPRELCAKTRDGKITGVCPQTLEGQTSIVIKAGEGQLICYNCAYTMQVQYDRPSRFSFGGLSLATTKGGGMVIYDAGMSVVAEVHADGSVSGDLVRAARMMAAWLTARQKQYEVSYR